MSELPPPTGSSVSREPPGKRATGSMLRTALLVLALSLLSIVSVLAIASAVGDDDGDATDRNVAVTSSIAAVSSPAETATSDSQAPSTSTTTTTTATTTTTSTTSTTTSTTTTTVAAPTTVAATTPPTDAPSTTVPSDSESTSDATETTDSGAESADAESGAEPAPAPSESGDALGYPVLPDGSPVPVEAVYEGNVVTLTGLVPSEEARMQLEALAIAGAPRPDTTAVNLLEINENVPLSVGARVLSLDSVRFPQGSAEITEAHAAEIDGVVRTLEALPHVTLLVIGHADPRGNAQTNLLLSQDRADSMVLYLASQGIEPSRMSSRAMGESNPISEANSDAALQLNRRTELIFYGLLAG